MLPNPITFHIFCNIINIPLSAFCFNADQNRNPVKSAPLHLTQYPLIPLIENDRKISKIQTLRTYNRHSI